ncbi:MAG: hypothetical protein JO097_15980 [Acidobacteriaceae bacterium]|nr:hypothetical protein [Acidobacteriaceae bacterium]MBV9746601.1 hypothetical protein [Terriglobia bacterium]
MAKSWLVLKYDVRLVVVFMIRCQKLGFAYQGVTIMLSKFWSICLILSPLITCALCRADLLTSFVEDPPLPDATFNQLVTDLNSNTFATRQAATEALTSYVDPASNTRLTVAQLQTMRSLAKGMNLEVARRSGQVMQTWVKLNPQTVGPATDLLNGIKVKYLDFDPVLGEGHFMLGSIKVGYDLGGIKFRDAINSQYWRASNELYGGYTDNVVPQLRGLRTIVNNLTDQDLKSLYFTQNGNQIQKADVLKQLDKAIQSGSDLINKINGSIGDPTPGPAPKVPVNGSGMIDTGKTFQLAVNSNVIVPGNLNFLDLPSDLSIADPPAGFSFFGQVFVLSADDSLAISGGSVSVFLEYGDPALQGLPTSLAQQLQLVHFANGLYVPLTSEFNDLGAFVFQGSYAPPSIGLSADQFGEFALVYPIPEPSSLTMILAVLVAAAAWRLACAKCRTDQP